MTTSHLPGGQPESVAKARTAVLGRAQKSQGRSGERSVAIVAGAGGERRGAAGTVLPARCFDKVLLLDQGTDAAKARAELDWYPSHPALVDEFRPRELPQVMGD